MQGHVYSSRSYSSSSSRFL